MTYFRREALNIDVQEVFDRTLATFKSKKGCSKSSNFMYLNPVTYKQRMHNKRTFRTHKVLMQQDEDYHRTPATMIDIEEYSENGVEMHKYKAGSGTFMNMGKYLYQKDDKFVGNCSEKSAYAMYLLSLTLQENHPKLKDTAGIYTVIAGSHMFALLGQKKPPEWKKLEDMRKDKSESMAIDPWVKINCQAKDYPDKFKERIDYLYGKGKSYVELHDSGMLDFAMSKQKTLEDICESDLKIIKEE